MIRTGSAASARAVGRPNAARDLAQLVVETVK